jgi:hypothetical protein
MSPIVHQKVPPSIVVAPLKVPLTLKFTNDAEPVKVGDAAFDLLFTAVAMLLYSVVNSAPFTTFNADPLGKESFAPKLVVTV